MKIALHEIQSKYPWTMALVSTTFGFAIGTVIFLFFS